MRHRLTLAAVGLLFCVAAVTWYITSHGGWINALGLPPVANASTPVTQNGFTLRAVNPPGSVFLREPGQADKPEVGSLLIQSPMPLTAGMNDFNTPAFTVTGRAATGEVFPLHWAAVKKEDFPTGNSASMETPREGEALLCVNLPAGYPGVEQFYDVTVADRQGHTARWRITRLPRMRHWITPPVAAQDTFDRNGLHLALRAWRAPSHTHPGTYIRYALYPTVAPGSHQWEIEFSPDRAQTDWGPFPHPGAEGGTATMPLTNAGVKSVMSAYGGAVLDDAFLNPFTEYDHYVLFKGNVIQFETYDEQITFHNVGVGTDPSLPDTFSVSQTQTQTTPSGITVTLPAQNGQSDLRMDVEPHGIWNSLPKSPLSRAYGNRPVQISIQFPQPLGLVAWSSGPGSRRTLQVNVPGPRPQLLKNLTVIVRQQVNLQSSPMTLIAPMTEAPATARRTPTPIE